MKSRAVYLARCKTRATHGQCLWKESISAAQYVLHNLRRGRCQPTLTQTEERNWWKEPLRSQTGNDGDCPKALTPTQPSFMLRGCMWSLLTGRSGCVQITPLSFAFHSPPSLSAEKLQDGSSYLSCSPAGKHEEGFKLVGNWSSVFLRYL